jgi:hypothetical protein
MHATSHPCCLVHTARNFWQSNAPCPHGKRPGIFGSQLPPKIILLPSKILTVVTKNKLFFGGFSLVIENKISLFLTVRKGCRK